MNLKEAINNHFSYSASQEPRREGSTASGIQEAESVYLQGRVLNRVQSSVRTLRCDVDLSYRLILALIR